MKTQLLLPFLMDKGKIYNALTFPKRKLENLLDSPAVVLLYHRVKELASDPLQLAVTPRHFEQQLKHLKEYYNVVTVEEFFFLKTKKKKFPPKTVLVTFDDGYEDNCNEAIPILEANSTQAFFFITTSNINTNNENWWDDLERIFSPPAPQRGEQGQSNSTFRFPSELKLSQNGNVLSYKTATVNEREQTYWSLQPILKFTKPGERNNMMKQLHTWRKISAEGRATHRMMTEGELKKLSSSSSAVIGAHTHSHASLACQTYNEQFDEIKKSKEFLESLPGKKITHFAYPFGTRKDFNQNTINVLQKLNIEMAFANYYGQVHRWTNDYKIPRMLVRDWDAETFKLKIKSFFSY